MILIITAILLLGVITQYFQFRKDALTTGKFAWYPNKYKVTLPDRINVTRYSYAAIWLVGFIIDIFLILKYVVFDFSFVDVFSGNMTLLTSKLNSFSLLALFILMTLSTFYNRITIALNISILTYSLCTYGEIRYFSIISTIVDICSGSYPLWIVQCVIMGVGLYTVLIEIFSLKRIEVFDNLPIEF